MSNRVWLMLLILAFVCGNAWSLRVAFPPTLSNPITDDQVASLNKYLKDIWNITNGRFELDVVSSAKNSAKNGEVWLNSSTHKIQWKEGGTVYSAP